jgi:hypothetical protein
MDKQHAAILKNKAAEAGISMKLMLETVLRETWPETFRIADEQLTLDRAKGVARNNLLHGEPDEIINIEEFIKARVLEREKAIAEQDAEEALARLARQTSSTS